MVTYILNRKILYLEGICMAKGTNQKLKLLYLMKIFMEETDEEHGISMGEIIEKLNAYGVTAERKSLYDDFEALRVYGLDIIGEKRERVYTYYLGSRLFELAELKLLVDSVQSSKFITEKKTNVLIKKIESLAGRYEAGKLQRQVYVSDRIKAVNESIYYNVDDIHTAINNNVRIRFKYFSWNVNKEMELRKNGDYYEISPWALCWDDENYYLIGYDSEAGIIKHYRVDKMQKIELTNNQRQGRELFIKFNMADYSKKTFGMFDGEEQIVKLRLENRFAGVIIDRFGKAIPFIKTDNEHFEVNVKVAVSSQFIGWVVALGSGVEILGPENVIDKMKKEVIRLKDTYL